MPSVCVFKEEKWKCWKQFAQVNRHRSRSIASSLDACKRHGERFSSNGTIDRRPLGGHGTAAGNGTEMGLDGFESRNIGIKTSGVESKRGLENRK